ncbi:hypothetical protein QBC33DRAFT_539455 [Phialemonium atrogriseum]|uniref:Uncharacterized protein n=1 Tax=Phialemonium atrogriseum TaxID=1093897 RepID=A0AAJ0C0D5_9PEZI|nr:uncharacterized protein QBC33DRAFT_539455 [Phialemonium atrogriseum]KAK1767177.1 hypothetical protein QBC33DRAFT_539455 [Phialemonium atrogriseum]
MEPPAKRSRFGPSPFDEEDNDDELFHEPEELNARRDPAVQLERSRAVAAYKLKSSWESIFEKYGKDFSGVGDEIDIRTGQVVVDNGHIRSLEDASDIRSEAGSVHEEERILHGRGGSNAVVPYNNRPAGMQSLLSGPPRLSSLMFPPRYEPSTPARLLNHNIESAWEVPDLPAQAFETAFQTGSTTSTVARRVTVKSLLSPREDEVDEDDILLGTSSSRLASTTANATTIQRTKEPQPSSAVPGIGSHKPISEPVSERRVEDAAGTQSQSPQRMKHKGVVRSPTSRDRGRRKAQVVILQDRQKSPPPPESATNDLEDEIILGPSVPIQQQTEPASGSGEKTQLVVATIRRRQRNRLNPRHAVPPSSELGNRPRREIKEPVHFVNICFPNERSPNGVRREDLSRALILRHSAPRDKRRRHVREDASRKTAQALPAPRPRRDDHDHGTAPDSTRAQDTAHPTRSSNLLETFSRNMVDPSYIFSDDDEPTAPSRRQIGRFTDLSNGRVSRTLQASLRTKNGQKKLMDSGSLPALGKSFYPVTKHLPSTELSERKILHGGRPVLNPTLSNTVQHPTTHDFPKDARPNLRKRKDPPSAASAEEQFSPSKESGTVATETKSPAKERSVAVRAKPPVTPDRVTHQTTPDTKPASSSRLSIVSLVSEGEEDELSLDHVSLPSSSRQLVLFNRSRPSPIAVASMRILAMRARRSRLDQQHTKSSPLLAKTRATPVAATRKLVASSPTTIDPDLVRTPGGSLRRCGEGGFRCERDFCFSCL